MEPLSLLKILVLICYLVTFVDYFIHFMRKDEVTGRLARPLFWVTLLAHLLFLFTLSLSHGHIPMVTRGEAMTTTVFCFAAIYLYIEIRSRQRSMGVFILAMALSLQLVATFHVDEVKQVPAVLASGEFLFHAVLSLLGYSGLFLGFIFSVLFLLMHYEIKRRRFGYIYDRLPPLETLDTMSFHSIVLGFCLLSVGIVAGSLWAKQTWGFYFSTDPKLVSTLVVWAVYGLYLLLRFVPGWTRKRSASLSVIGFTALLFTFVLIHRIAATTHNF